MDPITREEKLMVGEQLEPITRKEMFLAKAAGMDIKTPEPITREKMFISMISGGGTGGSGGGGSIPSVSPKAVNFYDYDGTCLYAYTVEEAQALTKMPPLPEREGLICQGWNWTLEDIKAYNRSVTVGATYTTDDGTTRIYITLSEGRTSPMLGVCPNGTVTVDWGDGTAPDTLTGTSTSTVKWTPNHNYAEPGDYVIRLSVDGEMGFYNNNSYGGGILSDSSSNTVYRRHYLNSVYKIEIGDGVEVIGTNAFKFCSSLKCILIPYGVTTIGTTAFERCNGLEYIFIPDSVNSISGYAFTQAYNIRLVIIPKGLTSIEANLFQNKYALRAVDIPYGVTSIGSAAFQYCYCLESIDIPKSVVSIAGSVFQECLSLKSVTIPENVTSIENYTFQNCYSLTSVVFFGNVTNIGSSVFSKCVGVRHYDFTHNTEVPVLFNTGVFSDIPTDCEIRVPAALYDEWIVATNWATYASKIVAV